MFILFRSATDQPYDSQPNTVWRVRVRVENDAGASPWSNELTVKTRDGAPGPVTGLEARPTGPTSVVATWREPDEPNGDITGYTLVYQLRSIGECGVRSAKPITVHTKDPRIQLDNLIPDATYEVHVIAHTSQPGPKSQSVMVTTEEDGMSYLCTSSFSILPSVPSGTPRNLRVTSITSTRAELLWNEIECELRHGKITGYDYEVETTSDWGRNVSETASTHRVSLDNLSPFTEYKARVRGRNNKGAGPFTEWVSFKTLPAGISFVAHVRN